MSELLILDTLKDFVYDKTSGILLPKPYSPGTTPELVRPNVFIGWMPPKNFNPENYDIPAIIIGVQEGSDDDTEGSLSIQLSFAVFDPGQEANPDMLGYKDLLYLMSVVRRALFKQRLIKRTTVQKPVTWGMYDEQPWPYWYGWMKFQATIPVTNFEEANSFLFSSELEIPANKLERS